MMRRFLGLAALGGVLAVSAAGHEIQLTGTVRDFKRGDQSGGHPDFETAGAAGKFGWVPGMVSMALGSDGKPVYNPTRPASKDTMKSATTFNQWYRDTQNVNQSAPLTIKLSNGATNPGGVYTFDNQAFFPIDGKFFGNQGLSHNYHFTFELRTQFGYQPGQKFTFIGDDDVFVFVNGSKVIDLGGVHSAVTGAVILFDGKAFVDASAFPAGGVVQSISTSMASSLATKWSTLSLGGTCPLTSGGRYIDLNLNGGDADVRCTFNGTSVTVRATANLTSVVLKFNDNTQQSFSGEAVNGKTLFTGTGAYGNKLVAGVWVKTAQTADGTAGQYYAADGSGGRSGSLNFFFAERHTVDSHFRVDTTMFLQPLPLTTVSPSYD